MSVINESTTNIVSDVELRVYMKRWYIAFLLSFENILNACLWLGYAPVINLAIITYSTTENIMNYSSAVFPLITVLVGFPTIWMIVKYGLRFTFILAAVLNFLCCLGRFLATVIDFSPGLKVFLYFFAQFIGAFAQSFVMFTPTKVALSWFPDSQRTTANTIAALGNPFGVMLGSLVAPLLVPSEETLFHYDIFMLCLGILGLLMLIPVIKSAEPEYPPSYAAHAQKVAASYEATPSFKEQLKYFASSIKEPLKNKVFVFIIIIFGVCLTYFTMISAYIQQILCTKGYSNTFAGVTGSVMIFSGLVLSGITAPIVDYTKSLFVSVRVFFSFALLGAIAWAVTVFFTKLPALVMFTLAWWGGWSFASYSLMLEISAEITYPVPETFTSGLLVIISQVMSTVVLPIFQYTGVSTDTPESVCGEHADAKDYSISNMTIVAFMTMLGIINLFLLKGEYRRHNVGPQMIEVVSDEDNSDTEAQQTQTK